MVENQRECADLSIYLCFVIVVVTMMLVLLDQCWAKKEWQNEKQGTFLRSRDHSHYLCNMRKLWLSSLFYLDVQSFASLKDKDRKIDQTPRENQVSLFFPLFWFW